jgi:alpha,alpha-trehalase
MLSNLLQELAVAREGGRKYIVIEEARLNENPVRRLSRMIKESFWDGLTRRMDAEGLELICTDPKNRSNNRQSRVYVPHGDTEALLYYQRIARERPHLNVDVVKLPEKITPQYVKSINTSPGILSLALHKVTSEKGEEDCVGVPFVVPGGRFNEMYGWDSYFESLGLLLDDRVDLAKGMVENFVYEIKHYGKILNANRSYYLTRSQPPFLTDMARRVFERLPRNTPDQNKKWLAEALKAAIKEYWFVWMSSPRYDPETRLSRYHPTGIGMPPETEATHFNHIIEPYAEKHGLSIEEFNEQYNRGSIIERELDRYFVHDRAVRESGHDTSYRLEKRCADLATIDLNSLLYKYEMDIGILIQTVFDGQFRVPLDPVDDLHLIGRQGDITLSADKTELIEAPEKWFERAHERQIMVEKYCWCEERNLYMDYDTVQKCQSTYESVTAMWTLYAGVVPQKKAACLVYFWFKFRTTTFEITLLL